MHLKLGMQGKKGMREAEPPFLTTECDREVMPAAAPLWQLKLLIFITECRCTGEQRGLRAVFLHSGLDCGWSVGLVRPP